LRIFRVVGIDSERKHESIRQHGSPTFVQWLSGFGHFHTLLCAAIIEVASVIELQRACKCDLKATPRKRAALLGRGDGSLGGCGGLLLTLLEPAC